MPRHLRMKHGSLAEVAAVCDKPSKQDVIRGLHMLANKGTFKYNQWRRAIEALEARAPPRRCGDSG